MCVYVCVWREGGVQKHVNERESIHTTEYRHFLMEGGQVLKIF